MKEVSNRVQAQGGQELVGWRRRNGLDVLAGGVQVTSAITTSSA